MLKLFTSLLLFCLAACQPPIETRVEPPPSAPAPTVTSAELKNHVVDLISENGRRCRIEYRNRKDHPGDQPRQVTLSMVSPCAFVGVNRALTYSYEGKLPRDVVIVVGGPPDPSHKDPLMEYGCGTQYQVVNFLKDGVRLSERFGDYPVCPSGGMDEIDFAWGFGLENESQ